ncbi:HNH endonuclease [Chitinimonas naiadis]
MKTTHREIVDYWVTQEDECGLSVDWAEAGTRCWRCATETRLDRCHIVPCSQGGSEHPSNLVLLCLKCHREAPNVTDPRFMWKWLRAHAVPYYDTYWFKRAEAEFTLIYGRKPMSDVGENAINREILYTAIQQKLSETSIHFGEGRLNPSTLAWLLFQAEQALLVAGETAEAVAPDDPTK